MTNYLSKKLAAKLNVDSIKQLPWSEMTAEDIINWPREVEFKRFDKMNTEELVKIHELVKDDKLDFSHDLISQLKNKKKRTNANVSNVLRSDITNNLGDKLARKLNVERIRIPWSDMTANDLVNWPEQVEFKRFDRMNAEELKKIHELVKEDKLDFSNQFISRLKINSKGFNELRSDIRKYLGEKLAKKLNVDSIRVPWSQMKATDIINWPENVEFKSVEKMGIKDIKILYQLAKNDQLDFSSKFLKLKQSTGS
jgi:cellulose biosynthesis protein BcsQ